MRRLAEAAVAVSILVLSGQAPVWAQGGKTPTYPVVPLIVEINDQVSSGAEAKIKGDGMGAYYNGAPDGTIASIDKYGNLIIKFGRQVMFSYGEPEGSTGPTSGGYANSYISTLNAGGRPLQNLATGERQCIKLNWQYDAAGRTLRHGFNRDFYLTVDDGTSYAVVTRSDPDTWMIEPTGSVNCAGYPNPEGEALVFSQTTKGRLAVETTFGEYLLPFRLTLFRQ